MAHKTKVGGTNYEVTGGKARVNGVNYSIIGGRTRVSSVGYGISFGVRWAKYNCTRETTEVEETYYTHESEVRENVINNRASGYASYSFNSSTGTFTLTGGTKTITTATGGGTVYTGGGDSMTEIHIYNVDGSCEIIDHWAEEHTRTTTEIDYDLGSLVGYVYAKEGERPDANNGYTYVTSKSGASIGGGSGTYIIMRNGSTYYAYKQV